MCKSHFLVIMYLRLRKGNSTDQQRSGNTTHLYHEIVLEDLSGSLNVYFDAGMSFQTKEYFVI